MNESMGKTYFLGVRTCQNITQNNWSEPFSKVLHYDDFRYHHKLLQDKLLSLFWRVEGCHKADNI